MACDIDCDTLAAQLADARAALHRLMLGAAEVSVTFGPSKATTFNQIKADDLRRYIAGLEAQWAECCGHAGNAAPARAAIRFDF